MDVRIRPTATLQGNIEALPSKNYTTRYMLAAALAEGTSTITHVAHSEDSEAMRRCLRDLGAQLVETADTLSLTGFGKQPRRVDTLDVGNAGAVLRFLMAVVALLPQTTFLNRYPHSLGKRPHLDLIHALQMMGVTVAHQDGKLPITVYGGQPHGGRIEVSGNISSQFLSALLFLTPLLAEDSEIFVRHDLKSKVVIAQTLEVIREAGVHIDARDDLMHYSVPGRQQYAPRTYVVQGDYPGSAALMAAAAVTSSAVTIQRLRVQSKQGERQAVDVFRRMGVPLQHDNDILHLAGNGVLKAVTCDGDAFTDAVLACVAAAVFAEGTSEFMNVENLRYKECDRITDFLTELRKAGADVAETQSSIIVHGKPAGVRGGVTIDAHFDHRVIMALTIIGLRAHEPIVIRDAHHVAKSYPTFFEHMRSLGAHIEEMV